ncbi:MAG: hypothetical protein ACO1N9_04135 [Flavobacterium sp.]
MVALIIGSILIVFLILLLIFGNTSEDDERNRLVEESLKDGLIYDPETGAKITLEQAESGIWLLPDEETKAKHEAERRRALDDDEQKIDEIITRLKSIGFIPKKILGRDGALLEGLSMLKKYDDWHYNGSYSNNADAIVFFPSVELKVKMKGDNYFRENQLMLWYKTDDCGGHYYFREKTSAERFTDIFRNDDEIKLDNYESFVIRKGFSVIPLIRLMQKLDKEKGLEIEVNGNNLFIKTLMKPTLADFERIQKTVNN